MADTKSLKAAYEKLGSLPTTTNLDGPAHLEEVAASNEDPVPVRVSMMVFVRQKDWEYEYSVDTHDPDYDFVAMFRDQFIADVQEFFVEQGEMKNVTEVTP